MKTIIFTAKGKSSSDHRENVCVKTSNFISVYFKCFFLHTIYLFVLNDIGIFEAGVYKDVTNIQNVSLFYSYRTR